MLNWQLLRPWQVYWLIEMKVGELQIVLAFYWGATISVYLSIKWQTLVEYHVYFATLKKKVHCIIMHILYFKIRRKVWRLDFGAFYLHLLEFTFVYQFYSRKTTLVDSTFWNSVGLCICFHVISQSFQTILILCVT